MNSQLNIVTWCADPEKFIRDDVVAPSVPTFGCNCHTAGRSVAASPMWRDGQRPSSADAMEEDDVVYECNVIGRPKPSVFWTYNARPITQGSSRERSQEFAKGGPVAPSPSIFPFPSFSFPLEVGLLKPDSGPGVAL